MKPIAIGSIVRIVAPGSRESEGEARVIPAIVTHQWPDGSLQLFCFHFQGSPLLQNAVRPEFVEVVLNRSDFDLVFESIDQRLARLESLAPQAVRKPEEPRFAVANDTR